MAKVPAANDKANIDSIHERHQLRILLVEDSPLQQMLVALLLKQLGHAVSIASDGFEALSAVQQDRCYDVVLIDCRMPLMDGFQASRLIREAERVTNQRIGVIGLSADDAEDACFIAGMDDFLKKPLNKSLLKVALGRWLRKKKGGESRFCETPFVCA